MLGVETTDACGLCAEGACEVGWSWRLGSAVRRCDDGCYLGQQYGRGLLRAALLAQVGLRLLRVIRREDLLAVAQRLERY